MNARHVHDFMRERFPSFDESAMNWRNVADAGGPRISEIRSLLTEYLGEKEVIVEIHRKLGSALPFEEAITYIASHIGQGRIRATTRECTGYVVVAQNGVACGWHAR